MTLKLFSCSIEWKTANKSGSCLSSVWSISSEVESNFHHSHFFKPEEPFIPLLPTVWDSWGGCKDSAPSSRLSLEESLSVGILPATPNLQTVLGCTRHLRPQTRIYLSAQHKRGRCPPVLWEAVRTPRRCEASRCCRSSLGRDKSLSRTQSRLQPETRRPFPWCTSCGLIFFLQFW